MIRGLSMWVMWTAIASPAVVPQDVDVAATPTDVETAQDSLEAGDCETAIQAAERLSKAPNASPADLLLAADVLLRCGHADRAVPLYDQLVSQRPEWLPRLWQRGIALYFTGQFAAAAQQFVEHREVNPHDVENAAWHFLCVAKGESFARAQAELLPAPHDPRVPMAEVLQMLASGDPTVVTKRLAQLPAAAPHRESARFYGHLYLGLFFDARGDLKRAKQYLSLAASDAPHHYMGDVARVYAEHLGSQALR